jgi:hypothetical protein
MAPVRMRYAFIVVVPARALSQTAIRLAVNLRGWAPSLDWSRGRTLFFRTAATLPSLAPPSSDC